MTPGRARIRALATTAGAAAVLAFSGPAVGTTLTAHHVRLPPVNGRFDYQIGGPYRPLPSVQIVDRDRTDRPAPGVYNICYVNAFQTQAYQDKWWKAHHPRLLLRRSNGKLVEDPGWPGEIILDTATAADRRALLGVIGGWVDGCAAKGFDAVEPDNLDSYSRSHRLLSVTDNFAFAKLLVGRAHADGLAIAQKNDAEHSHLGATSTGFDFAVAEECQIYAECSHYLTAYGDHVIEVEYTDNGRRYYRAACKARGARISIILRDRNVVAKSKPAYVYAAC